MERNMKRTTIMLAMLLCAAAWAAPASRFVECETFTDYGGWVGDPHSMKRMGSSYLMAHGCLPRDVYADHLDELKGLMRKGVPKLGVYHSGGCSGDNEFYHFKDTGHFPIWPNPRPMTPRVRDAIEKIGLRHRHEPKVKD